MTTADRSLKEILTRCAEIHKNLEPIKQKMLAGTATDEEIQYFSTEQGKSMDLLSKAMDGEFKPAGDYR
jgi:hypothetical protein